MNDMQEHYAGGRQSDSPSPSVDSASSVQMEAYCVDRQQVRDIMNEIIEVSVRDVLQSICSNQTELCARVNAIWGFLVDFEAKYEQLSVRQKPDPVGSAQAKDMHNVMQMNVPANESETVLDDMSSNSSGAFLRRPDRMVYDKDISLTCHSLDIYNLDSMKTDLLFETNGLNSSESRPPHGHERKSKWSLPNGLGPLPFSDVVRVKASPTNSSQASSTGCRGFGPDPSSPVRNSVSGMEALRVAQDSMLVAMQAHQAFEPEPKKHFLAPNASRRLPLWLLHVFGVLPCGKGFAAKGYVYFVPVLVALLFLYSLVMAVSETRSFYMHLTTACYAFGGLVGLISLRAQRLHCLLGPVQRPLVLYAHKQNFLSEWQQISLWRFGVILVLWFCIVLIRVVSNTGKYASTVESVLNLCSFFLVSGLLAALTFCQIHVCCGLELAIDTYCSTLHEDLNVQRGVCAWNVLQAILRRAAYTIDQCFLAMNTTMLATLLLTGVELLQAQRSQMQGTQQDGQTRTTALRTCWAFAHMALLLFTVFRAATVTEKCSRVPALVNSWMFEESQLDEGRQYIVQYITNSNAGFYVRGVRLNAFMALKLAYLFGIISFTLVSNYFLDD